jgi:YD repeat-containing protein
MKHLLLLFLLFTSSLCAEWGELFSEEEDHCLFHHVNVLSGHLNLCVEDVLIKGPKPFSVFRTYSSAGALESRELNQVLKERADGWVVQGGWLFFPHTQLFIEVAKEPRKFKIYLHEPAGALVCYAFVKKKGNDIFVFKPDPSFGSASGLISGRTNTDNNILELNAKSGEALVLLPNGGTRLYQGKTFHGWGMRQLERAKKKSAGKRFYRLINEVLPSGHQIEYTYNHQQCLTHLALKNPSKSKTLASLHLEQTRNKSPIAFTLTSSDGQTLNYNTLSFKQLDYLCSVQSPSRPIESHAYIPGPKGAGARLHKMVLAGRLQFEADYYPLPEKKILMKQTSLEAFELMFRIDRVRSLKAPLGPNGELIPFAQFSYSSGLTNVRDSNGLLIQYQHDDKHLLAIHYYDENDHRVSVLKLIWEGNRLKAKVMLNPHSQAHFSKVLDYDPAGNIVQETLWGELTGEVKGPFAFRSDGSLEGAESYTKRYAYLPRFNLPILEEEEGGLTYRYTYLPDTDLKTAQFTCEGDQIMIREFFSYDADHLLIEEITDDGTSTDPDDLSSVTERRIKRYQRAESGLIDAYTESYLDITSSRELLLKKTALTYSPSFQVIAQEVYDAELNHRYTLYTDYDAYGRVIRQTTPLGQENTYSYDDTGHLITQKEVGAPEKHFTYDPAGRPLAPLNREITSAHRNHIDPLRCTRQPPLSNRSKR